MLIPILEPLTGPDSYDLSATLKALATQEARDSGALDLNLPYGLGTTGFTAGMIGKFTAESGVTVLDLATATEGFVMFASNPSVDKMMAMDDMGFRAIEAMVERQVIARIEETEKALTPKPTIVRTGGLSNVPATPIKSDSFKSQLEGLWSTKKVPTQTK